MAVYKFKCSHCNKEYKKLITKKIEEIDCECGKKAKLQLPSSVNSTMYETKDAHRGVQQPKNQHVNLKQRMNDHHDRFEIERKIDEHGMDEAIRNNWVKKIKKI